MLRFVGLLPIRSRWSTLARCTVNASRGLSDGGASACNVLEVEFEQPRDAAAGSIPFAVVTAYSTQGELANAVGSCVQQLEDARTRRGMRIVTALALASPLYAGLESFGRLLPSALQRVSFGCTATSLLGPIEQEADNVLRGAGIESSELVTTIGGRSPTLLHASSAIDEPGETALANVPFVALTALLADEGELARSPIRMSILRGTKSSLPEMLDEQTLTWHHLVSPRSRAFVLTISGAPSNGRQLVNRLNSVLPPSASIIDCSGLRESAARLGSPFGDRILTSKPVTLLNQPLFCGDEMLERANSVVGVALAASTNGAADQEEGTAPGGDGRTSRTASQLGAMYTAFVRAALSRTVFSTACTPMLAAKDSRSPSRSDSAAARVFASERLASLLKKPQQQQLVEARGARDPLPPATRASFVAPVIRTTAEQLLFPLDRRTIQLPQAQHLLLRNYLVGADQHGSDNETEPRSVVLAFNNRLGVLVRMIGRATAVPTLVQPPATSGPASDFVFAMDIEVTKRVRFVPSTKPDWHMFGKQLLGLELAEVEPFDDEPSSNIAAEIELARKLDRLLAFVPTMAPSGLLPSDSGASEQAIPTPDKDPQHFAFWASRYVGARTVKPANLSEVAHSLCVVQAHRRANNGPAALVRAHQQPQATD